MARRPKTYDAADPAQEEKARAAASLREDQRRQVEQSVMATTLGREWVYAVLTDCGIWRDRLILPDAFQNGFEDGQREVGLRLMRRLARSVPAEFAQMLTENGNV